uniref:Uncharacterized protein n=1 Tax=Octopus bimaculoides TaxID=37653 RepID=A0A0L8HQH3_OCTBM
MEFKGGRLHTDMTIRETCRKHRMSWAFIENTPSQMEDVRNTISQVKDVGNTIPQVKKKKMWVRNCKSTSRNCKK